MEDGIGGDPCDAEACQERVGGGCEPTSVARLAGDQERGLTGPKRPEEGFGDGRVEGQLGRKLDQQRPQLGPQRLDLRQEPLQGTLGVHQPRIVGDRPRGLHREPEPVGRGLGPAPIGRGAMGSIEGRVDLGRIEHRRVSFEAGSRGGEPVGRRARYGPAGRADVAAGAHPNRLDPSTSPDEVHDDQHHGDQQQDVDERGRDVKGEKAAQPKHQQDHCDNRQHRRPFQLRARSPVGVKAP